MNRIKSTHILFFFIMSALFITHGCTTGTKPEIIRDSRKDTVIHLLPADDISARIAGKKEFLKKENNPEDKNEAATLLIQAYNRISKLNSEKISRSEYKDIITTLFEVLGKLEEKYFFISSDSDKETRVNIINDYINIKKKISESYLVGNYREVNTRCYELMSRYGKESLTPEIGLIFALSLARDNMIPEALSIGKKIIKDIDMSPDMNLLIMNIIKWELELGNRENAMVYYEKLMDDTGENNSFLIRARTLISEADKDNDNNKPETLSELYNSDPTGTADTAIKENLEKVDSLIDEKDFSTAKSFLYRWQMRAEEEREVDYIDRALKRVEAAEENLNEESNRNKAKLDEANGLIEKESFEEAIELLDSITGEEQDQEIKKLKDTAIRKLIDFKRDRAADYFDRANNSNNSEQKKTLYLATKEIIEYLFNTFPDYPRVKNLQRILDEINGELKKLPR